MIKNTLITNEFSYETFRAIDGNDIIHLSILPDRGQVAIVTSDAKVVPTAGERIIALVPPIGNSAFEAVNPPQ